MQSILRIRFHQEQSRTAKQKLLFCFWIMLAASVALTASVLCALSFGMALNGTVDGSVPYRLFCGFGVLLYAFIAFAVWHILFQRLNSLAASARKGGAGGGQTPPSTSTGTKPPPPDAGKPVPVTPSPKHHLVAAKSLPPLDKTHVFPKD